MVIVLHEYTILDNGCIYDTDGNEVPRLNIRDFDAVDQPEGAVALVSKIKRQIVTAASKR